MFPGSGWKVEGITETWSYIIIKFKKVASIYSYNFNRAL